MMSRPQWEYKDTYFVYEEGREFADNAFLERWLNRLGASGWEIVGIPETSPYGISALFKRPKQESQ